MIKSLLSLIFNNFMPLILSVLGTKHFLQSAHGSSAKHFVPLAHLLWLQDVSESLPCHPCWLLRFYLFSHVGTANSCLFFWEVISQQCLGCGISAVLGELALAIQPLQRCHLLRVMSFSSLSWGSEGATFHEAWVSGFESNTVLPLHEGTSPNALQGPPDILVRYCWYTLLSCQVFPTAHVTLLPLAPPPLMMASSLQLPYKGAWGFGISIYLWDRAVE